MKRDRFFQCVLWIFFLFLPVLAACAPAAPTITLSALASAPVPSATPAPTITPSPLPSATPTRAASPTPSVSPTQPTLLPSRTPIPIEGSGGHKIAFVFNNLVPPYSEIFVMNADGSGQTNLTNNSAWDCCPAWSPDGSKIVFASGRDGNGEIYVMNTDGSLLTRLTSNNYSDGAPAWSPDGAQIVFVANFPNDISEIRVMNADGSNQTTLATGGPDEGYYSSPSWSPDGAKIVFVREGFEGFVCQGCSEIFVMNADGSNPIQVTDNNGISLNPAWSPDGAQIAYETYVGPRDIGIVVMNPDGSGQTLLANTEGWDSDPSWSQDGRMIVFLSDRSHLNNGEFDIYIMTAFGSDPIRLTNHGKLSSPTWQRITQTTVIDHPDCTSGWSRLSAGGRASVSDKSITPNRVRSGPGAGEPILVLLYPGSVVRLIEGPVCAAELVFWKVENEHIPGGVGWTAEGDGMDYYLLPYNP